MKLTMNIERCQLRRVAVLRCALITNTLKAANPSSLTTAAPRTSRPAGLTPPESPSTGNVAPKRDTRCRVYTASAISVASEAASGET